MRLDEPLLAGQLPERDRRIRVLLDSGRIEEAGSLFDEAIAGGPNLVDSQWDRPTVLVHRSLCAWRLGRIGLALELAAEGWAEVDVDEPHGTASAQTLSMLGYLLEGHSSPAMDLLAQAVHIARVAGESATLAHCLVREATALISRALSRRASTTELFTGALERFEEALTLTAPGTVHRRAMAGAARSLAGLGELTEAESRSEEALRLSDLVGDVLAASVANWALSEVHQEKGQLDAARTFASRAVETAERIQDTLLIMRFSRDLGTICARLGDSVGEAAALRRTVEASSQAVNTLQEGLGQALEQRRLAVRAQRWATAAEAAAVRDPLTGLTNRLGLERYGPRLLEQTAAQGRLPWLVLLDVDWFKDVNDDAGHAAGDIALQEIAHLLRRECRANDLVCRWAGDEFVVLLTDTSEESRDAGPLVAERIRAAIDGHSWKLALGPTRKPPTASIGVAAGPAQLDQLFSSADTALYEAKRAGRNRIEIDRTESADSADSTDSGAEQAEVADS